MDCVQEMMKKCGVLPTRENYLLFAYWNANPDLDAEGEAMLPEEFQINPPENFE
jgi:hypothetical protein